MSQGDTERTYLDNLLQRYDINIDRQYWYDLIDDDDNDAYKNDDNEKEEAKSFINSILENLNSDAYERMRTRKPPMESEGIKKLYEQRVALLIHLKKILLKKQQLPFYDIGRYSPIRLPDKQRLKDWEQDPVRTCDTDGSCSIMGGKKTRTKKRHYKKKSRNYKKKTRNYKNKSRNYKIK